MNRQLRRLGLVATVVAVTLSIALTTDAIAWTYEDAVDLSVIGDADDVIGGGAEGGDLWFAVDPSRVVTDSTGTIYTIGFFQKPIDVDPTDGEDVREPALTVDETWGLTSYVAKFDSNGDPVWFHALPYTQLWEIAVSPDDQTLWLAGNTLTELGGSNFGDVDADLDTGAGEAILGPGRGFAASYTSDFEFESVTAFGGLGSSGIVVDSNGDPTWIGMVGGGAIARTVERILAGGTLTTDPSIIALGAVLVRLDGDDSTDSLGSVVWSGYDNAGTSVFSIDLGPDDDIIYATRSIGTYYADVRERTDLRGTNTSQGIYVSRFANDGTLEWSKQIETPGNANPQGGVVVDDDDNVVFIASVSASTDFDVATIGPDEFEGDISVMVRIDSKGTILSAEAIEGSLGFGPRGRITRTDDAVFALTVEVIPDQFGGKRYVSNTMIKYDLNGTELWRKRYGNTLTDQPFVGASDITPDRSGGVIRVGIMLGRLPTDPCVSAGPSGDANPNVVNVNYLLRTDEFGAIGSATSPEFTAETLAEIAIGGDNWVQIPTNCPGASIWEVTEGSLPDGLTLDPTTGIITGEPAGTGPYEFTIRISNAAGTVTRTFSGDVTNGSAPTWPDDTTFGPLEWQSPYSRTLRADGGPAPTYEITDGFLPSGLSFDERTGSITGTPSSIEDYSFTITATNAFGTADITFTGRVGFPGGGGATTTLPGGGGATPSTTPTGTLPSTGSSTRLALFGLGLVAAGLAATATRRRTA